MIGVGARVDVALTDLAEGNVDVVTASARFFISIRIVDDQDVAALDLVGDIIAPLFLRDAVSRFERQRFDDVIPHPHTHFLDSHASPHRPSPIQRGQILFGSLRCVGAL